MAGSTYSDHISHRRRVGVDMEELTELVSRIAVLGFFTPHNLGGWKDYICQRALGLACAAGKENWLPDQIFRCEGSSDLNSS